VRFWFVHSWTPTLVSGTISVPSTSCGDFENVLRSGRSVPDLHAHVRMSPVDVYGQTESRHVELPKHAYAKASAGPEQFMLTRTA